MIKAVLFDLDGTLLPMDNEVFTKVYFKLLCKKLAPYGYESEELIQIIWAGTKNMVMNNGTMTNEEAFWSKFEEIYGNKAKTDRLIFDGFYENEFQEAKSVCGYNEASKEVVDICKSKGVKVALATNPIFPSYATESRMRWAGLDKDDFEIYTTYENIGYSKPNLKYYIEIINRLGVQADECIMIGNDVDEDMVVEELGMKVFLLSNDVINKSNKDISQYPSGDFEALKKFLQDELA